MRSVVVVLPASMWAMIPILRVRSSSVCAILVSSHPAGAGSTSPHQPRHAPSLPAIVRERLVRLRHAMHVVALLHRGALPMRGVQDLTGQFVRHGAAIAAAR